MQGWQIHRPRRYLTCEARKGGANYLHVVRNGLPVAPGKTLPFVQWGGTSETYVQGVATWPAEKYAFPPDLWAPLTHTDVWTDCNTAINNVVGPVRPTKDPRCTMELATPTPPRVDQNDDHQRAS